LIRRLLLGKAPELGSHFGHQCCRHGLIDEGGGITREGEGAAAAVQAALPDIAAFAVHLREGGMKGGREGR